MTGNQPAQLSPKDATEWLDRFAAIPVSDEPIDDLAECHRGHHACSDRPGGHCADEVMRWASTAPSEGQ